MTNLLSRLSRRITRALARLTPVSHFVGGVNPGSDPGRIHDGLDYGLPVVIHGYMRDWDAETQQAYLNESARDTYRFQFDTPQRGANDMPFVFTEDPLREWNAGTREYVVSTCHATYHRNPIAKRGIKYSAAFSVGKGFNLACKNKDVEKLLNDFIDNPDNAIREYEQQAPIDLLVDGELMLRFYDGAGETAGQTVMVPMRPWECQWIVTEPGFFRRPSEYHFLRYITAGDTPAGGQHTEIEDVPANEIQHVAINRHGYELRGRPELYDALPWLRATTEWLQNRARQNHWRGALVWDVKIKGRPDQVAAKLVQYQRPPAPGSIAVHSDLEEWQALTNSVGASDAGEDGRQIKLMSAVSLGVPEYFLGDGQNANLASSKSQQLPALVTFGEIQQIMVQRVWTPVFKRVLQNAIAAGNIPEKVEEQDADGDTLYEDAPKDVTGQPKMDEYGQPVKGPARMIDTLAAFGVTYEPVSDDDPQNLAQALQIAAGQGWVSSQTASEKMGFDYTQEQKRMDREEEESARKVASGQKPPPVGMRPDGLMGEPGGDGQQQPAMNGNGANNANR